jgi:toxin HigB-1
MIKSIGDPRTERLFADEVVREFEEIVRRAKRKLEALHAAARLDDLRVPPSNRLEKLKGDLKAFYSIRVNDRCGSSFAGSTATPTKSPSSTTTEGSRHG